MNWSVAKIGTIYQKPAQAIGLSTPPIGCVLDLSGLPGGGNKIYDRSPYGSHGTITGAVWRRLPSGLWYLDFDGTDDIVTIADSASLSALSTYTLMAWIKVAATGEGQAIISKMDADEGEWILRIQTGQDKLLFYQYAGGVLTNYRYALSPAVVTDTNWHLAAVTWDGVNAAGHIKINFDGVEQALDDEGSTGTGAIPYDTALDIEIGRGWATNDRCWNGDIALPRIYNRALSALEIQNHYQREKHLFGVW